MPARSGRLGCQTFDVRCLQAFRPRLRVELNRFAFLQSAKPFRDDGRVMDKYVLAVVTEDESESLLIVEPLDLPRRMTHNSTPKHGRARTTAPDSGGEPGVQGHVRNNLATCSSPRCRLHNACVELRMQKKPCKRRVSVSIFKPSGQERKGPRDGIPIS